MLSVVSVSESKEILKREFTSLSFEEETVELTDAVGRTLCSDIISKENIPPFDRSTVDGFAVKAENTYGSGEFSPCQLNLKGEILMGEEANIKIAEGECVKISTGGMLPEGANAVVMVENTDTTFEEFCLCRKAVSPFENVNRKGDDIKENDVVLKKGTLITSRQVGILASLGVSKVKVYRKIRAGIISTGDEIVPVDTPFIKGKIRNVNSAFLFTLLKEQGALCKDYGIVKDSFSEIENALIKAAEENDIVLISGGSSAGARDMTSDIIKKHGEVFLHGIAMKPGKPTIIGKVKEKAVFGLPGHPAAAYFVSLRLVVPFLKSLLHSEEKERTITCPLLQNISSNHGREEIVCVKLIDNKAQPVFAKSGVVSLLSQSDGYIVIDRDSEGLKQGEEVTIHLFQVTL